MMKTVWTDEDGDTIELNHVAEDGGPVGDGYLCLWINGDQCAFAFDREDAVSFAKALMDWAER